MLSTPGLTTGQEGAWLQAGVCLCVCGCGLIPGYRERPEAARAERQAAIDNADMPSAKAMEPSQAPMLTLLCRMNLSNNREADQAQKQAWLNAGEKALFMQDFRSDRWDDTQ
jgi:hypothetical protein